MAQNLKEELLLAEFTEAWSHYRHIEATRQKYLTLFFGFLGGISGLLSTLASKIDLKAPLSIAGLAGLLYTFSIFSALLFANTKKMGCVLHGYERTLKVVREIAYGVDFAAYESRLSVRTTEDPIMKMNIYRLQVVSEVVFATSAILFAGTIFALLVAANANISIVLTALLLVGATTSLGLILYILLAPVLLKKIEKFRRAQTQKG